jgi:localization factor PodJL
MSFTQSTSRGAPGEDRAAAPSAGTGPRGAGARDTGCPDTVAGNADDPWDETSAEALTRAWETAEAEAREHRARERCARHAASPAPAGDGDAASLDARLAAFAATLDAWLQQIDPAKSQAALHLRLQQFEQRLEAALDSLGRSGNSPALLLIEAQVGELNGQFAAMRAELERVAGVDGQLAELSRVLSASRWQATAGGSNDVAAESLGPAVADGSVHQLAQEPPPDRDPLAAGRDIIARLEELLDKCMAARRRDEERSASLVHGIDEALARIVARIGTLEAKAQAGDDNAGGGRADDDDRLAQAYAAGARALGQDPFPFALDAADYLAGARDSSACAAGGAGHGDAGAMEERERRLVQPSQRGARTDAPATEGPSKARGALLAAMALLFAGGYLAVDAFLAPTQPPGAMAMAMETSDRLKARPPTVQASMAARAPAALVAFGNDAEGAGGGESTGAQALQPTPEALVTPANLPSAPERSNAGANSVMPGEDAPTAAELPAEIGSPALRAAAGAGDPAAQFEIASRFAEGSGVAVDLAQAFHWLQRAAMRGHGPAQYRLGIAFERGNGVVSDPERAKAWYRRAAEQGVVRAMHNLAVLTIGLDRNTSDYATAARWFAEAADLGLVDSQFNLGLLYEDGLGVPRDLAAAYRCYALAARAGDREAGRRLEGIKPQLSQDQLEVAERAVSEWRARAQR